MSEENERMHILEMIENGQINAEEGLQLLQALNGHDNSLELPSEAALDDKYTTALPLTEGRAYPVEADDTPDIVPEIQALPQRADSNTVTGETVQHHNIPTYAQKWRRWWMIPLWIGVAITISGGVLMYFVLDSNGIGLWFILASVPFLIGVIVMALAWASRSAPWLHLRIQEKSGEGPERIALSLPLPIRPTAWFLRTFGHRIPKLEGTSLDEVILAVGKTTSPENPIYIHVDEGENGEKVEIFIG
jgi:hypothetical protein